MNINFDTISNFSLLSDENGKLSEEILNEIYRNKWFELYIPNPSKEKQISFIDILKLLEKIACHDGSTGWAVTLCSGASWFYPFFSESVVKELSETKNTCITGSGAIGGIAEFKNGEFVINGEWPFASGLPWATHFTANCLVKEEGKEDKVLSFVFRKDEVEVFDNWKAMGMRASGSHGFRVKNLRCITDRVFEINGKSLREGIAYKVPFLNLAEATLAVNFSGLAQHFIEALEEYVKSDAGKKKYDQKHSKVLSTISDEKGKLEGLRCEFYKTIEDAVEIFERCETSDNPPNSKVSLQARKLAHESRRIVDELYLLGGLKAASVGTEMNLIWRDMHTASQHSLMTFK